MTITQHTLLIVVLIFAAQNPLGQEMQEYHAQYVAEASGLAASAERHLQRLPDGSYRLEMTLTARALGIELAQLRQSSDFVLPQGTGSALQPLRFLSEQTGISAESVGVTFDWAAMTAISHSDDEQWSIPLSPGVMDALSLQLALRRELLAGASGEFSFDLIDEDEKEVQRYRTLGRELLSTELGALDCLVVERIREGDEDRRSTRFWLAVDWDYLLAGLEQIDRAGRKTRLSLQAAQLGGVQLTSRP